MKTMEELGLYGEQPDRKVVGVAPDDIDPAFAQVTFNDGTTETMPTSQAEALPQEQTGPVYGQEQFGPPPAPPPAEPGPNPLAQAWDAAGQDLEVQFNERGVAPPGYTAPLGTPSNPAPNVAPAPGEAGALPAPLVDPMAEVVDPGSPGGFADFARSESSGVSETHTADDPGVMQGRIDEAYDTQAQSAHLLDTMKYRGQRDAVDTELDARDAQAAELQRQLRQAELEKAEHERIYKAVESTPIDEDGFWSESPGRAAGAWIALALSGFLQGVTRGQNPALNQMVQALNHAQDRWLANQQKSRDSQLRQREKLMGSTENAVATMRLQLSGIVEKRIQLEAQREGMTPPPALESYRAQLSVKRAEDKNAIGSRIVRTAQQQSQAEQRATPATGPVRRGDVVLRQLGIDDKAHADAMDPKGLNLGGVVQGAARLQDIGQALERIAAEYDGSLPSQETISLSKLGLAPLAARLGFERGKDEVSVKQLLEEAKLAYKQTVNIKSIDSENEGKNFNAIIDSGEGESTLAAIKAKAQAANQSAIGIAQGVTRDTQGYIDFIRQGLGAVPGVTRPIDGGRSLEKRDTGHRVGPSAGGEAETLERERTGGGPATRPLARQPEPPQALRVAIAEHAEEAGLDPDALARIIRFESGGKPGARNAQSGATGLIQFMPDVYANMKKPPGYERVRFEDLGDLSVDEQMPLVIEYFRQKGVPADADAGEYYLAVAAPAFLGKPDESVVYPEGSRAWQQNPAWRPADGGGITVGDIRAKGRSL